MSNHGGGAVHFLASYKFLFTVCGKDASDVKTVTDIDGATCKHCIRVVKR